MSEKKIAVSCLLITILGWILGTVAIMAYHGAFAGSGEFGWIISSRPIWFFGIPAFLMHLISLILGTIHLIQCCLRKIKCEKMCVLAYALSLVYMIIYAYIVGSIYLSYSN